MQEAAERQAEEQRQKQGRASKRVEKLQRELRSDSLCPEVLHVSSCLLSCWQKTCHSVSQTNLREVWHTVCVIRVIMTVL